MINSLTRSTNSDTNPSCRLQPIAYSNCVQSLPGPARFLQTTRHIVIRFCLPECIQKSRYSV